MYYMILTLAGIAFSAAIGCMPEKRYDKVVGGGITGILAGLALVIYGRYYTVSPENMFAVTDVDMMFAGLTVGIIGAVTAFYLCRFVALESEPPIVHVSRGDIGYWPRSN